jgi:hypothetical protein
MNRWIAFLPLVALAALAVLFAGYALHRDPHVQPHTLVGKPVPDLTLPDLVTGQPARLKGQLATGPVLPGRSERRGVGQAHRPAERAGRPGAGRAGVNRPLRPPGQIGRR